MRVVIRSTLPALAKGETERTQIAAARVVSEEVMQVAARLAAALDHSQQVVLVTGYDDQDQIADSAAQIALGLARVSQAPVALLDGQKEAGSLHRMFGSEARPGLGELIQSELQLAAVAHEVAPNVSLIPSGDPSSALAWPDCNRVSRELRERYRYVVIAARPLLFAAEAVTLGSVSDGVVLVLRRGVRNREQVLELQRELVRLKLQLFGAVLREGK